MRVLMVAGARPNFVKIAPILRVLEARAVGTILVHTGQHYDHNLSDAFFRDLRIRPPDHHLSVGSGSHAVQTARVMEAFEPILITEAPDWVVVVGDVNSTLAAALVTAKLREGLGCRLAHVEAGLRTGDWRMPEEVNRVLTDRLSDLLFTPSRDARERLLAEGITDEAICFVGNVMIDSLFDSLPTARNRAIIDDLALRRGGYALATLHRPSNVDQKDQLKTLLGALRTVAKSRPVVLPLHPRTAKSVEIHGLESLLRPLVVTEPLGYLDMLALLEQAEGVLTDSGGVQEETTALGVPCVTLREHTERPVTIHEGTNRLAPWPLDIEGVAGAYEEAVSAPENGRRRPEGWDGQASQRIADALLSLG